MMEKKRMKERKSNKYNIWFEKDFFFYTPYIIITRYAISKSYPKDQSVDTGFHRYLHDFTFIKELIKLPEHDHSI